MGRYLYVGPSCFRDDETNIVRRILVALAIHDDLDDFCAPVEILTHGLPHLVLAIGKRVLGIVEQLGVRRGIPELAAERSNDSSCRNNRRPWDELEANRLLEIHIQIFARIAYM